MCIRDRKIGLQTSANAGAATATAAAGGSGLGGLTQSNGFKAQTTSTTFSASSNEVTITFAIPDGGAGEVLPTATLSNANPAASTGTTYFLHSGMFNSHAEQDYLGTAIANGTKKAILRGVVMFPSGVLPALQFDGSAQDANSAAWGEFATGKDSGGNVGDLYTDGSCLLYTSPSPRDS